MNNTTDTGPSFGLPDDSLFSLSEYLEMWQVATTEPGFRILYLLQNEGELSTKELSNRIDRSGNALHYHLGQLRQAALIRTHKGPPTGTKETYTTHEITDIGATVLAKGPKTGIEQFATEERALTEVNSD